MGLDDTGLFHNTPAAVASSSRRLWINAEFVSRTLSSGIEICWRTKVRDSQTHFQTFQAVGSEGGRKSKLPLPKDRRSSTRNSRQGCTTRRETLEAHRIWQRADAWIIASGFARNTKVECKYWNPLDLSTPPSSDTLLRNSNTRNSTRKVYLQTPERRKLCLQPHRRTCWGNSNDATVALERKKPESLPSKNCGFLRSGLNSLRFWPNSTKIAMG